MSYELLPGFSFSVSPFPLFSVSSLPLHPAPYTILASLSMLPEKLFICCLKKRYAR
jgi:hypothetical protein